MPQLRAVSLAAINQCASLPIPGSDSSQFLEHLAVAAYSLELSGRTWPATLTSVHLLCLQAPPQTIDRLAKELSVQMQHKRRDCYYVLEGKMGPPHPMDVITSVLDDLSVAADDVYDYAS